MSDVFNRPGLSLVATMPEGIKIVGMIEWRGMLVLATSEGVYRFDAEQDAFVPLKMIHG